MNECFSVTSRGHAFGETNLLSIFEWFIGVFLKENFILELNCLLSLEVERFFCHGFILGTWLMSNDYLNGLVIIDYTPLFHDQFDFYNCFDWSFFGIFLSTLT